MESEAKKKYEIGVMLEAEESLEVIFGVLEAAGAVITEKNPTLKMRLAYPIKKQTAGYFTFAIFELEPAKLKELNSEFTGKKEIIRFLIITPPVVREERRSRSMGTGKPMPARSEPVKRQEAVMVPEPRKETEAISNELLEKKLEEILG